MLYNINIKIIGDIWEYQEHHDLIIEGFKAVIERMLSKDQLGLFFRGDINFDYIADKRKFVLVDVNGKLSDNIKHLFETDSVFRKKYYLDWK